MADTFIEEDTFLEEFFKKISDEFLIHLGCFQTDNPSKFAMVEFTENQKTIKYIEEKNPLSNLKYMWGFWFWNSEFTEILHSNCQNVSNENEQTLSSLIEEYLIENKVEGIILDKFKYWDLGTFDEINRLIKSLNT